MLIRIGTTKLQRLVVHFNWREHSPGVFVMSIGIMYNTFDFSSVWTFLCYSMEVSKHDAKGNGIPPLGNAVATLA